MEDALAYEDIIKLFWFENRMDVCRRFAKKEFVATVCRLCLAVGHKLLVSNLLVSKLVCST